MSRTACLVVPRFPVAATLRVEPELRGVPLVVCEPERGRPIVAPRAFLVGVSREAERLGVRPGLTVAQALAHDANLTVRPLDECALAAAHQALVDVASSVSPRIEPGPSSGDTVLLDVEGLERLFGSSAGIAASLSRRAERIGLAVGVAIADAKPTARIAAEIAARRSDAIVVPPGEDASWLAPLPLSLLSSVAEPARGRSDKPIWPALQQTFERLGIARIGDLARLPLDEIGSRFGEAGARLARIAAGLHRPTLEPVAPAPEFSEAASLDYAVDSLEALLFLLRGLLDRIVSRLAIHSLACRGLEVILTLEDGGHVTRTVGVLAPTSDVKSLAVLTRAVLEASPPHAAVVSLRVDASPDRPRRAQLDLFRPAGPPPERLAMTLVRLEALCGAGRVGQPVSPSGHRPEAFGLSPFDPENERKISRGNDSSDGEGTPPPMNARTALRAIRPPLRAEVFQQRGTIAYVRAAGLGGRAVVASGPWRIDTEWWNESPCRRDYWDVQLSDGGVYRVYREPGENREERWFVDGCYD